MKDFNRGGGFRDKRGGGGFDRRDSGGRGGFNRGGGFDRPAMHKAICAECGDSCEVPFKPTGERPVYCSNCFKNKDEGAPRRDDRHEHRPESRFDARSESRDFVKPSFNNNSFSNEQFETLNAKLDKILRALNAAPVKSQAAVIIPEVKEVKKEEIKKEDKKSIKKTVKKAAAPKAKVAAKKKK